MESYPINMDACPLKLNCSEDLLMSSSALGLLKSLSRIFAWLLRRWWRIKVF
jgi:hypothetical protein